MITLLAKCVINDIDKKVTKMKSLTRFEKDIIMILIILIKLLVS